MSRRVGDFVTDSRIAKSPADPITKSMMKITYATMSGDRMEDLHRELDRAIEQVRAIVRQELSARRSTDARFAPPASSRIAARSTRASCSARFRARAASRCAKPSPPPGRRSRRGARGPWRERVALLKKVADAIRARRWELSALMGYEAGKNRLECVGDVEESADLIEYYCDQIEQHRRLRDHARHARSRRRELERAAAVRRVGGHLAVQLSAGARGRTRRRRARRRQHRRLQAGVGDAAPRLQARTR